jgi:hypothetical protein
LSRKHIFLPPMITSMKSHLIRGALLSWSYLSDHFTMNRVGADFASLLAPTLVSDIALFVACYVRFAMDSGRAIHFLRERFMVIELGILKAGQIFQHESLAVWFLDTTNHLYRLPEDLKTWQLTDMAHMSRLPVCSLPTGSGPRESREKRAQMAKDPSSLSTTVSKSVWCCQKCGKSINNSKIISFHGLPFVSPRSIGGICLNRNQMDVSTGLGSFCA